MKENAFDLKLPTETSTDKVDGGFPGGGLQVVGAVFLLVSFPGLVARRLTASRRALPSVFILGAPKAGSTSLAAYLARHPAYVSAQTRELTFLQDLPNHTIKYERNRLLSRLWGRYEDGRDATYRKFFPRESVMRRVSRKTGTRAITGDHTPFYMYCPKAQRRIRELSPDAKFIVSLRDPVSRAFSDWKMNRGVGLDARSFEQAVADEIEGKDVDFAQRYLYQGCYAPHLRRWLDEYPRDRFLIVESSRAFREPAETVRRMFSFLDLPPFELRKFPVMNRGFSGSLQSATQKFLRGWFRPHNDELYELLGEDLGWKRD